MWHLPLIKGCLTTAGLIVAIGAQNAFVLKQGLMKNQVFITALFCSLVDASLIFLGVNGFGALLAANHSMLSVAKWGGALFLFWYGLKAFRAIFYSQKLDAKNAGEPERPSLNETVFTLLAVTFLNPHVYLDTIVLLGSVGSQFEATDRSLFACGAIFASIGWFFGLCYGARLLAPFFQKAVSWKILDGFIGCTMWIIGLSLLLAKT